MRPPAVRRRAAAALLLGLCACAGSGVRRDELPAQPIAFVHRSLEEGRQRAELIDQNSRASRTPGVVRLGDVEQLLGGGPDVEARALRLHGRLALLDPVTLEVTPLEAAPRGATPLEWSADHERLLFAASRAGRLQVHELDRRSGEKRPLTRGPQAHGTASYGPEGRLAFTRVDGSGSERRLRIYATSAAHGEALPLTEGPADRSPSWSPDGAQICFVTQLPDGAEGIAVVRPGGGAPQLLTRGRDPVFTRDGGWIVYSTRRGKHWQLWRMRPDGSGKTFLGRAQSEQDELHPAVSPDGRLVVYVSQVNGRDSLRVRRFDGSGDRPLLESGDGSNPVW